MMKDPTDLQRFAAPRGEFVKPFRPTLPNDPVFLRHPLYGLTPDCDFRNPNATGLAEQNSLTWL